MAGWTMYGPWLDGPCMDHGWMDHVWTMARWTMYGPWLDGPCMDHGWMDHGTMALWTMGPWLYGPWTMALWTMALGSMDLGSMDHGWVDHGWMDHGWVDHGWMDHGWTMAGWTMALWTMAGWTMDHGWVVNWLGGPWTMAGWTMDHGWWTMDHGWVDHGPWLGGPWTMAGWTMDHGWVDVDHGPWLGGPLAGWTMDIGWVDHGWVEVGLFMALQTEFFSVVSALVSTGGRSVQAACDWLFSHVDDPSLDDPLPREYVLYLRPSGPLQNQLSHFWQQSRVSCGKNKAHNIFPHITLCQFFMCADQQVEALCEALRTTVTQWKDRFPSPLPLELYSSASFIGLFVEEQVAQLIKLFAADFAALAAHKAEVQVEPHQKQLHVTLAYHFPEELLGSLEELARGIEVKLGCDWLAVLFSRDIRFVNHESLQVVYPYGPQNEDELELVPGEFVFMSPGEQGGAIEGWVQGTSLTTGLSGLLPENFVSRANEADTWVFHCSYSFFSCGPNSDPGSRERGRGLSDSHRPDNTSPGDTPTLSLICHPMQVLRMSGGSSRQPKRGLLVCRHGERMDVVFGKHWRSLCFDSKGRYVRSNLNMPPSLPLRSGGQRDYDADAPITVLGSTQARLVGEALLERSTLIDVVYCSPSLRCVQTAHSILQGMQQEGRLKVRVEPGLFEWTKWVSGSSLPAWIPPADLASAAFCVDTAYRPFIPISKLTLSESYESYISRSYHVTKDILSDCRNTGNKVLLVAHASSLDACTRQLQGRGHQNPQDFIQGVRKVPYLGFCACEEQEDTGMWQLVDPPVLPLTHGPNHSFDWRESLLQE
ncbi:hypothetical protein NHX12_008474 [Muraenolepis orangiensis]|uniref:SH3 domain-containing protein n=1 Tax=Muraenolepis orangiensis TaxID=630683 RepID=A0A9Q0DJS9_9TELE|nr:hypothetical protein NHX12_008474 [Muraenolepis orangiensis]